jgi:hypothetical protein
MPLFHITPAAIAIIDYAIDIIIIITPLLRH